MQISDVPGDNPIDIASGPSVRDPTTCSDALAIIRCYGIDLPVEVMHVLTSSDGNRSNPMIRVIDARIHVPGETLPDELDGAIGEHDFTVAPHAV